MNFRLHYCQVPYIRNPEMGPIANMKLLSKVEIKKEKKKRGKDNKTGFKVYEFHVLFMSESEILGSSETTFFKVCFTHTNIFLVFHHIPTCIISLMNAKKHVFGMYLA